MRYAFFPLLLSKVLRLPRKSEARSYKVLRLSGKIILANLQIWCSKMQPLSGNQHQHLWWTCLLHRACHAKSSLQILFKCPTPADSKTATKPSRFAHFWQGAESLAPAMQNHIWTLKSGPSMWCFKNLDLEIGASRHLRATGVHFFDMSTSKSGPTLRCFVHFDFDTCFALPRCAFFHYLNFQKWSETETVSFLHFWLRNVLRATTACNFLSLIWPNGSSGSAPAALARLLFDLWRHKSWVSGSALLFWTPWKNTVFCAFSTFSCTCIFFPLTLSLLWSSFFFSSLLWLFPPLLFHLSILSEVWLPNFLR